MASGSKDTGGHTLYWQLPEGVDRRQLMEYLPWRIVTVL